MVDSDQVIINFHCFSFDRVTIKNNNCSFNGFYPTCYFHYFYASVFLFFFSRMLGLTTVACVAHGPVFGDAEASVPVVMRAIHCRGFENDLNECGYELAEAPGPANETCEDGTGAGAVCVRLPRK